MGASAQKIIREAFLRFWPYVGIVAVWLIFSLPYVSGKRVPFPSDYLVQFFAPWNASYAMPVKNNAMPDVISQIYPWKLLTTDTWKKLQVPLWNPYSFSGTAHAANNQSAVFSPMNALFVVLPFVTAWTLLILLQPLLAGLFTVLFLRSLGLSRPSSFFGALAFMFCGFMTTWMAYGTLGYAAVFLPLALYGVVGFMGKRHRWYHVAAVAGAVAFSFLSGHFQISVYVTGAILLFILFQSAVTGQWFRGLSCVAVAVSGVLLASPQLFLTFDAYRGSVRSVMFGKAEIVPWQYLVTVFSPDFFGNPVTRNDWFGHYAEWSSYIGALPLLLTFAAVFNGKKERTVLFFTGLAVLSLLMAYQSPVSDLLFALKIPALSTSAASRILVLFSFSAAVLSAFGLDSVWNGMTSGRKNIPFFVWFFSAVLTVIWIAVLFFPILPKEYLGIAKRNLIFPSALSAAGIMCLLSGLVTGNRKLGIAAVMTALLLLTVLDMVRYAKKWMPASPAEFLYPRVKMVDFLLTRIGNDRVFGNIGGEVGVTYRLPLIEGYDALYQGRYGEFINAASTGIVSPGSRSVVMFDKYGRYARETLQLLGVRYIAHRLSDGHNVWAFPVWQYPTEEMRSIYRDEHYELFDFTLAYPRAFLADAYVTETDNQKIIETLFAPGFNRRNTLILETKPDHEPATGTGSATIASYTPNVISIRTESEVPKLLFLSDTFDPGWKATVDGKPATVLRADYDFRAVSVDAGNHTVTFTYSPNSFKRGLIFLTLAMGILSIMVMAEIIYAHRIR